MQTKWFHMVDFYSEFLLSTEVEIVDELKRSMQKRTSFEYLLNELQ